MPKIINRQLFSVLLVGTIASCSNDHEYISTRDEGIELLNNGAKTYNPSGLAYGSRDVDNIIKANSILVFDVELVDILR